MDNEKDLEGFFQQAKAIRLNADEKKTAAEAIMGAKAPHVVREGQEECLNGHMAWSFDDFLSASQSLRLAELERKQSFERIAQFMREHPLKTVVEPVAERVPLAERISSFVSSLRLMPLLAFAFVLLVGGGVTSVAAQGALPGDALYGFKIHVNENVRHAMATSVEAESKLDAELVERRLSEARELAAQGAIDVEIQKKVAVSIESQVASARRHIAALSVNDVETATDVSTALDATLKAHSNVFNRISSSGQGGSVDVILSSLKNADVASAQLQADLRAKFASGSDLVMKAVAEKSIQAAQKKMDSVKSYLERKGAEITADAKVEMEARLRAAQTSITDAQAKLAAGAMSQALSIAGQASADAQESQALSGLQQFVKVRVNADGGTSNVNVDVNGTGVPNVDIKGNGTTRVRINGVEIPLNGATSSMYSSSSISSLESSAQLQHNSRSSVVSSTSRSSGTQTNVDVNVIQNTTRSSGRTHVESHTEVNTNTNVDVQGGGSVNINNGASVNVNSNVKIGN